jgi:thiamine pyrophosphokinase
MTKQLTTATFSIFCLLASLGAYGAEKAAREIHARLTAQKNLSTGLEKNVTILEKDMGQGVRCFYTVPSTRKTASDAELPAKNSPAVSCLKVD